MTVTLEDNFRAAVKRAGLTPPEVVIADGKLRRFPSNDRANDDSAWYVLYGDALPAGVFGDWRTGVKEAWSAKSERRMTVQERSDHRQRIAMCNQARKVDELRAHAEAAERAAKMWEAAVPATDAHPYLQHKQVKPYGVRMDESNNLIIPVHIADAISTVQTITPGGQKRFAKDGAKRGGSLTIGDRDDRAVICIAEGYATAASIHEATGYPVVVAFDAGNLLPVAEATRAQYPDVLIVVCADNDIHGDGRPNTGVLAARAAANAVGGLVAVPEMDSKKCDYNDLHVHLGLDAVRAALDEMLPIRPTAPLPEGAPMNKIEQLEEVDGVHTPLKNAAQLHTPPALAKNPNILAEFKRVLGVCGVVGEERCACTAYLALTSRLLKKPVSMAIKGLSSSGKSYTLDTTLKYFPTTSYIALTGVSEKALIYMKEVFKHKTIVLYEASALREQKEKNEGDQTAYFLRTLLSEGRISYSVTVRDKDDGFVTKTITKEGPTNVIITTTATTLHGENETRMLSIPTNDTNDQTKAIMRQLAGGPAQEPDFKPWHALQDWLEVAEHRVKIPYAAYLAENIPPVAVRLRRDFGALLQLISVHAILHQCSRERDDAGQIVATADDYLAIRALVADLMAAGVGQTVSEVMRETVMAVKDVGLANPGDDGVLVQELADYLKLDRSAVQRRVQAAREKGFLVNIEEKRGRAARYAVGEPLPEEQDLLPLSVPRPGCAHTTDVCTGCLHSVSASNQKTIIEGVQLCSETVGVKKTDGDHVGQKQAGSDGRADLYTTSATAATEEEPVQLFEEDNHAA